MSELRLSVMQNDHLPSNFSCGINSIDEQIRGAFCKTLFKQARAYNITVDGHFVGNCMIKLVSLRDENAEYYSSDKEFVALEISYLAVDKSLQGHGIGSAVLKRLISEAKSTSEDLPIRFLILDAFKDKEKWYTDSGFSQYPKKEDLRYPDTVPMRMDFMNIKSVQEYAESLA